MCPWEGVSQCAGRPLRSFKGSEIIENRALLEDLGFYILSPATALKQLCECGEFVCGLGLFLTNKASRSSLINVSCSLLVSFNSVICL